MSGLPRVGRASAGACIALLLVAEAARLATADAVDGQSVYEIRCAACHRTGLLGAPRIDRPQEWSARAAAGREALVEQAVAGVGKMPPKGGNPGLSVAEIGAAVDYMLASVQEGASAGAGAEAEQPAPSSERAVAVSGPASSARADSRGARPAAVNAFNRLMRPPSERNPPPLEDGIHDPAADGTAVLQAPRESFSALPKSTSGNRVDWMRALDEGQIAPRFDLLDASKAPVVMDLNIVREVKGSMPDVVYPHRQHTEWLDCSNCHTEIFVPKKGANAMSMAGILLGEGCGVCHGKVAFPVGECRRCHSRNKPEQAGK